MELSHAIQLINHKNIFTNKQTLWADLGCGSGLFTTALASLLKPGSKIFAVDKNISALNKLQQSGDVTIEKIQGDFITEEFNLNNLDGILMANSLHYVKDKTDFINKIAKYLKPSGCFLIVEYDMDKPNPWVPSPLSYYSAKMLFEKERYSSINKIYELPSRYNRAKIYSVVIKR